MGCGHNTEHDNTSRNMYSCSLKQREKDVELYIKNGLCEDKTIQELGYPLFNILPVWY